MALLERIFGQPSVGRSLENPSTPLSGPAEWLWEALGATATSTGERVNRQSALTYAAFWRGVNLLANAVAKLPVHIYERDGEGKIRDTDHPSWRLLRRKANAETTAFTFKQTLVGHAVSGGNGYAYIDRLGDGTPVALIQLDPDKVVPVRENGRLWYLYDFHGSLDQKSPDPSTLPRKLAPDNVFHLKGFGYDGLEGYNVIAYAKESLGLGLAAQKFGAIFFKNNARPSVVLQHPGRLKPEAKTNLRESWERLYSSIENSHRVAILEEAMTIVPFSHNARDSQLMELRDFEIRQIANWLGVPAHKLGDSARTAYNSLEMEEQSFLNDGMDPWLCAFEEEAWDKLLSEEEKSSESHVIEFMRSAMIRTDLASRFQAYNTAIMGGFMAPDEARGMENWNPMPGGEGRKFFRPLNMVTVGEDGVEEVVGDGDGGEDPAEMPEKPAKKPKKEQKSADPGTVQAARHVLADALRRMTKRLALHARKAARNPKQFIPWLEKDLETEHLSVVLEALEPAARAAAALLGAELPASSLSARLFGAMRSGLLEVSGGYRSDELAFGVGNWLDEEEKRLPEAIVSEILGTEGGQGRLAA